MAATMTTTSVSSPSGKKEEYPCGDGWLCWSPAWMTMTTMMITPKLAFLLVAFSLGELGDGLNIFQGIYLVGMGWKEGSVGAALSLMGLTTLLIQPLAGDWVDKATLDRRVFLAVASIVTALSASSILWVHPVVRMNDNHHNDGDDGATAIANGDHLLIYTSKVLEGIASSFIGPCLAALTLASFGPHHFDAVMASNIFWGHVGSVSAAVLAGMVAYVLYPNIKYCFLVIGASALVAIVFVKYLPQGDPLMGRGFRGKVAMDQHGLVQELSQDETDHSSHVSSSSSSEENLPLVQKEKHDNDDDNEPPTAASYMQVFLDPKTCILCLTGFFFHFANANVLLVLGELMGGGHDEDGSVRRTAIPLTAGAIVTAQVTMAIATWAGDKLTAVGVGRKPLFLAGILSLPIRCALIIWWKDAGSARLLSTQVLDGIGGGLLGLIHPYLVADITFGTGRFNVVMGLTASFFGLGATLSNFLGQMIVEHFGHVASLSGSLLLSIAPILIFSLMPETYGCRGSSNHSQHPHSNKVVTKKVGYQSINV
ncbi:hypothetical protein ACA910_002781 [Epithemia clementina (nom. ined.)]